MDDIPDRFDPEKITAEILENLVRIIHKAAYIDNQPVDLGEGATLTAAEIHLIDLIGRKPDESVSDLASHLGITKGAVSQIVQKLLTKGFITRSYGVGNRKTVCLNLTSNGRKAYSWHTSLHLLIKSRLFDLLHTYPPHDLEMLHHLLSCFDSTLDYSLEIRDEHTRRFLSDYSSE